MKHGIHPDYRPVKITCVGCNTVYETRSTAGKDYHIEICSQCHPFFTGRQRLLDTAGRVERFRRKYAKKEDEPAGASETAAAEAGTAATAGAAGAAGGQAPGA